MFWNLFTGHGLAAKVGNTSPNIGLQNQQHHSVSQPSLLPSEILAGQVKRSASFNDPASTSSERQPGSFIYINKQKKKKNLVMGASSSDIELQ